MKFAAYIKGMAPQYGRNMRLALPVMLSQVGQIVVQLVDNAMVGRLGAVPLAAVSFAGAVFSLFMLWGMGLSIGLTPLVGEAYSRRGHRRASAFFQNSLILFTAVGVGLFIILQLIGGFLDRMGQPVEVVAEAGGYYNYLAWSVIPFMIFAAFKQFLEGIGNTRTGMVVVLTANAVNVLLNYAFIYGHWGAPAMGAAGAGLATLVSRIIMPLLMVVYFARNWTARRYLKLFSRSNQAWEWVKTLLRVGFPISMQMLVEMSAFSFTLIMMGWIGTHELAAHQIVVSCGTLTFVTFLGISAATTIMVSHDYGVKNYTGIARAATASYHLGFLLALVFAGCFIVFRRWIPLVFTDDPLVVEWASQLLIMAALYQIADSMQVISLGILRGMQDVKITMWIAFLAYIGINLPVSYLCAFTLKMGPSGLWMGFILGLSFATVLFYLRYRRNFRKLAGEMPVNK